MRRFAAYRGAVSTRTDQTWTESTSSTGVRHLRKANLEALRNRARQLDRDNVLASGILDRAVDNIVGSGMNVQARTTDKGFNDAVEEKWKDWSEKCDVRGLSSFADLQRLLLRAYFRDGDVGINLLPDGRLQAIEGDLIESPQGSQETKIVDGVEVNRVGRPVRFHVKSAVRAGEQRHTAIAAQDFVYLPRMKRLNQTRGEPVFAPVMPLFDQIDGLVDGTVIAARMAANFGLLIHESPKERAALPKVTDSQGTNRPQLDMEPGMIKWLGEADTVTQVKPEQPTQSFPDFIATLLRFTGLNLGLPLELIFLDFSRTNYSSARAALLQSQRSFNAIQNWFISRAMSRLYNWRVQKWINDGELNAPDGRTSDGRPIAWEHEFIAPGWQWVDPVKEAQAIGLSLDLGLTTIADELSKVGSRDFENVLDKRRREIDAMRTAGMDQVHSTMTRDATNAATARKNDADS